ncbi:hypothetical protein [Methylobacterium bullatum]|nr:hypothetical protein [Methylobacterium bullatum]
MTLEETVTILLDDRRPRYLYEKEFAVASFSGWVNSPNEANSISNTVFAALIQAIHKAKLEEYAIPQEWFTEVFDVDRYIKMKELFVSLPLFWDVGYYDGYNDCIYAADVVRFMLTFNSKDDDKRKKASLGKAWEFINKHGGYVKGKFGFGRTEWTSISNHSNIWRAYKKSAVFQCARYHGTRFDWYIDPRQPLFLDSLIQTALRQKEITTYFGEALGFQERLRIVLDGRSMSNDDFFLFPPDLTPIPFRLPPMSATAYGKMATYRRSSNLSNPEWD